MKMMISKIELDSKLSREPIPLECLNCGKIHYRPKNTILRILNGGLKGTNKGCYCSKQCGHEHKTVIKTYYCKQCKKEVKRTPSQINDNIFCSSSCSAIFSNHNRKIWKLCLFCKTKIDSRKKYCSHICQSNFKKNNIYNQIENGTYTILWSKQYRDYLIEKYGAKCMECGWNKVNSKSNKSTIQLEHIDGNSQNNNLSNLKLLCPNCHSLTPTFGGLNRGKGRHYRRVRYAAGKSF